MRNKNRADWHRGTLALIVVTAMMSAVLFTGCGDNDGYVTPPAKLVVNGADVNVPYIATINGKEVSLDEYRYYFLTMKYVMDNGDDSYWSEDSDGSRQRELKSIALQAMNETHAVEALAEELNLSLTDDELSQIEEDVKNQISALGSSEEYTKALGESYLTDELYRFLWKTNFYCEKLWAYYFSPDGPYYNVGENGTLLEEQLDEQYQIKFKALIAEAVDKLTVVLTPEYDLISIESLV